MIIMYVSTGGLESAARSLSALLAAIIASPVSAHADEARLRVVDVGNGLWVIAQAPGGTHKFLVRDPGGTTERQERQSGNRPTARWYLLRHRLRFASSRFALQAISRIAWNAAGASCDRSAALKISQRGGQSSYSECLDDAVCRRGFADQGTAQSKQTSLARKAVSETCGAPLLRRRCPADRGLITGRLKCLKMVGATGIAPVTPTNVKFGQYRLQIGPSVTDRLQMSRSGRPYLRPQPYAHSTNVRYRSASVIGDF
jgi:hypothetical protein